MISGTLTVSENQRDIVRRGAALQAEISAKALARWFVSIEAGYPDRSAADHARESVEGILESLQEEVAVLMQVPWSDEEERDSKAEVAR